MFPGLVDENWKRDLFATPDRLELLRAETAVNEHPVARSRLVAR